MHDRTIRVTVDSGVIEGFTADGVHRWRSIPYARPPVGRLRLRAPQPVRPWPGVRYCHAFGYCAPQERKYTMLGLGKFQPMGEDCLTVNVVAPESPPDRPLPVMFFIHGGGYILGSSATPIYDGAAMARRGCVYVSVNYRLGALGCMDLSALSTAEDPIEDNLFLRDLVASLRWVRDNIAVFGGDPDNVTIFGESAGAYNVATLMAVPEAKGLFAQAISESPASGMAGPPEVAAAFAEDFAAVLGVEPKDGAAALMAARPAVLVDALNTVMRNSVKEMRGAFVVGPTYDTEFLPHDPVQAMRRGSAHRVPLIVGTNADEGRLFTRFLKLLPVTEPAIDLLLADSDVESRDRITKAYPGYPSPSACISLGGDFIFGTASWQIAAAHGKHAPTYVYRYDYAPRTFHWSGLGATHATELFAVFDVYRTRFGSLMTAAADRRSARRVSNDVQGRWRAFSRTGVPGDGWPQYSADERAVMIFDRKSRLEYDPNGHRRQAWEGFTLAAN
ncbi:carboxylesterase/lipase family protein [Mycolicibacterium hodleri]|uniref:Carboxylic ester hydrolase n=1 Tax=Mycolicibacterium hodleri TaxID=49897 RepID=A0A502E728_9MYCO|nr:carboxylesterase/lipase family protein [Mycolicibacterium hodleri]TPG33518.1 carboxylesterase/lipase family protein [Mycolicibacterium hodleri]